MYTHELEKETCATDLHVYTLIGFDRNLVIDLDEGAELGAHVFKVELVVAHCDLRVLARNRDVMKFPVDVHAAADQHRRAFLLKVEERDLSLFVALSSDALDVCEVDRPFWDFEVHQLVALLSESEPVWVRVLAHLALELVP